MPNYKCENHDCGHVFFSEEKRPQCPLCSGRRLTRDGFERHV